MSETKSKRNLISNYPWTQHLIFWFGALVVGILIWWLNQLANQAEASILHLTHQSPWLIWIISPCGLILIAILAKRFFPGTGRSGVPEVKHALELTGDFTRRKHLVSLRIAFGKMLLPVAGIFSGASAGLGGPSVQIGASIMSSIGKLGGFPPHYQERGLILAGSAAGFAALFSAPLAGILFAIEEMGRTLEANISSLVITAIIIAGVTAYALSGNYIFLQEHSAALPWSGSWLVIPLCAVIGGVIGGLFSRCCLFAHRKIKQLNLHYLVVALCCGLLLATIAWLSDGSSIGTGYLAATSILTTHNSPGLEFPLYKIAATFITFVSGIPSGIFVPSLAIGGGIGSSLSEYIHFAPATVVILLSMTAYFAGVLQSPLTSFALMMEITNNHELMLALMATAFIAARISRIVCPTQLYRALADELVIADAEQEQAEENLNETDT
ncbi:MAG: chloride channel protein [Gammaproteobacteria bacterium]|nr:chloride channel protein [Gammaproteobacteria bacterium]